LHEDNLEDLQEFREFDEFQFLVSPVRADRRCAGARLKGCRGFRPLPRRSARKTKQAMLEGDETDGDASPQPSKLIHVIVVTAMPSLCASQKTLPLTG
jgi:hypothetical protein